MPAPEKRKIRARSLRSRLTLVYVALLVTILSLIGLFVRQSLLTVFRSQMTSLLEEEFDGIKDYLRFENGRPTWFYDRRDPEESWTVDRIRRVLLVSDSEGNPVEISPTYHFLGIESPEELRTIAETESVVWKERANTTGASFLVRVGTIREGGKVWVLAIGRSLTESQRVMHEFTRFYFVLFPFIVVIGATISWFLAGRALGPVNDLAATARSVSGSSLKVRIPTRGARDELDDLIVAFNQMMERLEQSFQQTRQFSADVSHELRTPLTALRGHLEVGLMTARNEEQYRDAIMTALQEVERITQVVRALLHLAQAESGQLAVQKSNCNISELVREIVEQFEIPAIESEIKLSVSTAPDLSAAVDRVQIERLLTNLLTNAIKFTPAGGQISVSAQSAGESIVLRVQDTGKGIPAENLPHIFNRFYRVPRRDGVEDKGLGLGLSFVAWIVKAHGGKIEVASTPGEGSTFTVTLPAQPMRQRDSNREHNRAPAALQPS